MEAVGTSLLFLAMDLGVGKPRIVTRKVKDGWKAKVLDGEKPTTFEYGGAPSRPRALLGLELRLHHKLTSCR